MRQMILIAVLMAISNTACVTGKDNITCEFPAAMKPEIRAQYAEQWKKGKVLYDINCAKCHNSKVNGKTIIPDFTQEQLAGYEFRVLNKKHEDSLTEETVSPEELGHIVTFLTYKKKNKTKSESAPLKH